MTKSRSISNISHSAFKSSRPSTLPFYQRRWASDEAEKKEDLPIEKTEATTVDEAENAAQTEVDPQGAIEAAESKASEFVSDAAQTVKETANDLTSTNDSAKNSPVQTTIYLGNLFFDVNEDDLQRELSRFGELVSLKVVRDSRGLSKG